MVAAVGGLKFSDLAERNHRTKWTDTTANLIDPLVIQRNVSIKK
jgi:hypothetical protein